MKSGRCLCGSVVFTVEPPRLEFGACHCSMCRRWTGSAFLGMSVPADNLQIEDRSSIRTHDSSSWAQRAWCDGCGSGLWYRITRPGRFEGRLELPIGLLDDASDLTFVRELFIDHKPSSFAYEGERRRLTQAQVERLFRVSFDP